MLCVSNKMSVNYSSTDCCFYLKFMNLHIIMMYFTIPSLTKIIIMNKKVVIAWKAKPYLHWNSWPGWNNYRFNKFYKINHKPESPPINGLFSKCSTNSLRLLNFPIPNVYLCPSQPIWKCFTEFAHLIFHKNKQQLNN